MPACAKRARFVRRLDQQLGRPDVGAQLRSVAPAIIQRQPKVIDQRAQPHHLATLPSRVTISSSVPSLNTLSEEKLMLPRLERLAE